MGDRTPMGFYFYLPTEKKNDVSTVGGTLMFGEIFCAHKYISISSPPSPIKKS